MSSLQKAPYGDSYEKIVVENNIIDDIFRTQIIKGFHYRFTNHQKYDLSDFKKWDRYRL